MSSRYFVCLISVMLIIYICKYNGMLMMSMQMYVNVYSWQPVSQLHLLSSQERNLCLLIMYVSVWRYVNDMYVCKYMLMCVVGSE